VGFVIHSFKESDLFVRTLICLRINVSLSLRSLSSRMTYKQDPVLCCVSTCAKDL
jgi:hypothetical protein